MVNKMVRRPEHKTVAAAREVFRRWVDQQKRLRYPEPFNMAAFEKDYGVAHGSASRWLRGEGVNSTTLAAILEGIGTPLTFSGISYGLKVSKD